MKRYSVFVAMVLVASAVTVQAHVGEQPSVHDTVAGVLERLCTEFKGEDLVELTVEQVEEFLTPEEREVLATGHLTFHVNVPVVVSVIHDVRLRKEPFWLQERKFKKTKLEVRANGRRYDVWEKKFDAGHVGLGVNSFSGHGEHYFVAVRPQKRRAEVEISDVYPAFHSRGAMEKGARIYCDDDNAIESLPEELEGQILVRGADDRTGDARLVGVFRFTPYPATDTPDQVVLTWSDDPKTTQTVQWRTTKNVDGGVVVYREKAGFVDFNQTPPTTVNAESETLVTPNIANDSMVSRHTAVLSGLEPGTSYVYAVGDGSEEGWTELAEFTTAPATAEPFAFIYMGDAQNGLDQWGQLVHKAYQHRPDAAFYVMAGDLVNRGAERDDWDSFFHNAEGIYDRRQLVPALGNHEYHGGEPELYLKQFALPTNGPDTIAPEKAYAFEYSNALFVVLDSNMPAPAQAAWLEEQLANTDATWKFVVYHHPAYSSSPGRNNVVIRKVWGELFDKYHVDLALQGHDHAYLRTHPMKAEQRVDSPAEGTIYIVSVSGTKYYDQGDFDYTEFGMVKVSTYQALDIQIEGDRLVYRSYDIEGELRDEFVIEK